MNMLRSFLSDTRGNATIRMAVVAGALSFVAVLGANYIDRSARDGSLARMASGFMKPNPQVAANRPRGPFDYTATGSIEQAARNVILDPCLGIPK